MEEFHLEFAPIRANRQDFEEYEKQLNQCHDQILQIKRQLRSKIVRSEDIGVRLQKISTIVIETKKQSHNLGECLGSILKEYENTEKRIQGKNIEENTMFMQQEAVLGSRAHGGGGGKFDETIKDEFEDGFESNGKDSIRDAVIEEVTDPKNVIPIGGFINWFCSVKGPEGANSFIMVDPRNLGYRMIQNADKIKLIGKGLTGIFSVIGALCDYNSLIKKGESIDKALSKSIAHVGVGLLSSAAAGWVTGVVASAVSGAAAGGAAGSVVPGAGNLAGIVVGGAVGLLAGVVVNTVGNMGVDRIIDTIPKTLDWTADRIEEAKDWTVDRVTEVKEWADNQKEKVENYINKLRPEFSDAPADYQRGYCVGSVYC